MTAPLTLSDAIRAQSPASYDDPDRYRHIAERTDRYSARLDDKLATFTTDKARLTFLDAEFRRWYERFAVFQVEAAMGVVRGDATAFDYTITMADIDQRRAKYRQPCEAA